MKYLHTMVRVTDLERSWRSIAKLGLAELSRKDIARFAGIPGCTW
jgi:hypothetical protein